MLSTAPRPGHNQAPTTVGWRALSKLRACRTSQAPRDRLNVLSDFPLRLHSCEIREKSAGLTAILVIIPTCLTRIRPRSRDSRTRGHAMLTHAQIWNALDRLAARSGLSASGLAKRAGLDPTTFNKSKRITPDGRQRWPSTESVAKSLAATSTDIDTFVSLIEGSGQGPSHAGPLIGVA